VKKANSSHYDLDYSGTTDRQSRRRRGQHQRRRHPRALHPKVDYFAFNVTALFPALPTDHSDRLLPIRKVNGCKKYVFDSSNIDLSQGSLGVATAESLVKTEDVSAAFANLICNRQVS
jgi:hypothetical protein